MKKGLVNENLCETNPKDGDDRKVSIRVVPEVKK